VIVATFFYHRRMNPHFRRYWVTRWRLNSMLSTFLSGIQVVKAFGQDDQEEQRYQGSTPTRSTPACAWTRPGGASSR
jgi:ABC-type multidrug transport system fused ATPase/permease subunit